MTIFRFSQTICMVGVALAISGCDQKTMSVPELMASGLSNEQLLDQFGTRLDVLSQDRAKMDLEMSKAGFAKARHWRNCGTWEYPKSKNGMSAFVQYCEVGVNAVEFYRFGITRGSMSYD